MPDNQETAKFMKGLLSALGVTGVRALEEKLTEARGRKKTHQIFTYRQLYGWATGETTINAEQMHALQTQLGIKL